MERGFCIMAFPEAPGRVGEFANLEGQSDPVLGRHGTLPWGRHRPGTIEPTGPLNDPQLSRKQLQVTVRRDQIEIENLGRLPLRLNGQPATRCPVHEGDLIELGDRVMLRVSHRRPLPPSASEMVPWGGPDAAGWVGESDVSWHFRERLRFVSARGVHVLVTGPSGSGKEFVARALHAQSGRGHHALVTRSAATIPESLADAELFGNTRGYPNPGMPARPGLIGEADGSTLFLDEFGELPEPVQARLLRVADDGEYTRLGEARARRSDLRIIAATNRDLASLKHDLRARFKIHVTVPPLEDRLDDIPLLVVHLIRRIVAEDEGLQQRLFAEGQLDRGPRVSFRLLRRLLTERYTTHVRQLEGLLWSAIAYARDGVLDQLGPEMQASSLPSQPSGPVDPGTLDPVLVQAVLDRHGGHQEPAWRELGLSSRHVLARFVKKHGLRVRQRG
ncbi:MAG: sigma 54-interacting transcriptional regulator [Myxococcota bacterium]